MIASSLAQSPATWVTRTRSVVHKFDQLFYWSILSSLFVMGIYAFTSAGMYARSNPEAWAVRVIVVFIGATAVMGSFYAMIRQRSVRAFFSELVIRVTRTSIVFLWVAMVIAAVEQHDVPVLSKAGVRVTLRKVMHYECTQIDWIGAACHSVVRFAVDKPIAVFAPE